VKWFPSSFEIKRFQTRKFGTQSFSRLFADDTSLLYSSNNINEIEVIVNSDLSKIYNGSKEWLVTNNVIILIM
jgi:hypothetical protein